MLDGAKTLRIQGAAQAGHDHAPDQRGIAEAHFGLGGVDIDVDLQRRDVQEEGDDRMPVPRQHVGIGAAHRSEEHTSELQSLMRNSYAVFCLKKKIQINKENTLV